MADNSDVLNQISADQRKLTEQAPVAEAPVAEKPAAAAPKAKAAPAAEK